MGSRQVDWKNAGRLPHKAGTYSPSMVEKLRRLRVQASVNPGFDWQWPHFAKFPRGGAFDPQSSRDIPAEPRGVLWSGCGWGAAAADIKRSEPVGPLETAADVLDAINDSSNAERARHGILEAEVAEFDPAQTSELIGLLRAYIERFYTAKDEATLTAVGAAVRSYVVLLSIDDLDSVATLLSATEPMPSVIENEIAKMVVRKLTAVPPVREDAHPRLATQLVEMAQGYLPARILPRDCCGPAALNAVIATAMLTDSRLDGLCKSIRAHPFAWFRQQIGKRANRVAADLKQKFPAERIAPHLAALGRLSDCAKQ